MTIDNEAPSCGGCSLRCGFRQERSRVIDEAVDLTSRDLTALVTKIYGIPLFVLLTVSWLESALVSIDLLGLLFILLSVLPASVFLMTHWARANISEKNRKRN